LKRAILCVMSLMVLLAAWPATAQESDTAPPAITEEERALQEAESGKARSPLGASLSVSQSIGGGTFVADPYIRRASYDVSLSMGPYWRITPLMRLSMGLSVSQAIIENYSSATTLRNRTMLSDLSFSLAHMRLFEIPVLGIGVSGSVGVSLPTSIQSQYRGLYFSSKASLGMSKVVGPVYLAYRCSAFKNLNRYTSPIIDKAKVGEHVVYAHYAGNEQLTTDLVSVGGNNTSFGVVNSVLASWNIGAGVSFAVMYAINNAWAYNSRSVDEFSSDYAEDGAGQRDAQTGVVDVSYQFSDNMSVSLGSSTMVAPKSANNKDVIFPFLNFSNNHRNSTAVYMSLNGNF
jgi:hypothetical protein